MGKKNSIIVSKFNNNKGVSRFLVTKSFDEDMSKTIMKELGKGKLYFSDDGCIQLANDKNFFLNPLLPRKDVATNMLETNLTKSLSPVQKFFSSKPLGKYILHTPSQKKPDFKLLYNPIPRDDYCSFYGKKENYEEAKNFVAQYCVENRTDPACSCINIENQEGQGEDSRYQFCMQDILGGNEIRKNIKEQEAQTYGTFQAQCKCLNAKCLASHPIRDLEIKLGGPCATENNITLCNAVIKADGAQIHGNLELKQNCSSKAGLKEEEPEVGDGGPTLPPPVAVPPTTPPPDNNQTFAVIGIIIFFLLIVWFLKK